VTPQSFIVIVTPTIYIEKPTLWHPAMLSNLLSETIGCISTETSSRISPLQISIIMKIGDWGWQTFFVKVYFLASMSLIQHNEGRSERWLELFLFL